MSRQPGPILLWGDQRLALPNASPCPIQAGFRLQGKVLDVVVDIRKGSPNFGKHLAVELSSENQKATFIPRGFAHGYACLSETALFWPIKLTIIIIKPQRPVSHLTTHNWQSTGKSPKKSKSSLQRIFSTPLLRQHSISTTISQAMTKILVIGAKGQLGQSFQYWAPHFTDFEFFFKDLPEFNILKHQQLEKYFTSTSINIVINCAAYTAVDQAEDEPKMAQKT